MKTLPSIFLCAVLALFGLVPGSGAQTSSSTFTGTSSANWNVAGNWLSGALPSIGDELIIPDTTVNNSLTLNDAAHTIGLLQMGTTGGRANPALAVFTINGNTTGSGAYALTMTNGLVATGNFNVSGTAGLQLKLPVIIQGDQTWNIGGNVGSSTADYGVQLTVGANGTQRPLTLNGTLTKTGAGQLNWVGQNVGNGNIVINQGSLKFNAGSSTTLTVGGTGSITVNNGGSLFIAKNSGTLAITKSLVFNNGATLRLGGNSATENTVGSAFSFNGTVPILLEYASLLLDFTNTWSGAVTSTITGSGGTINLWGNDSALTGTVNNSGTFKMRFGSTNSGSAAVAWALNNAAAYYEIYGAATNLNFGSLSGSSGTLRNSNTNNLPAAATVGILNTSTTFGGTIADNTASMALIKVGAGTLTLTGANTYSGGTVVSNGSLTLQSSGTTGSGSVTMIGGTTLSGNGTASGPVTVLNGAAIEADGGAGSPPLSVGSLTLGTTSTDQTATRVNVYLGGVIASGGLIVNGANVINILGSAPAVGVYNLITYTGGSIGGAGLAGFKLGSVPYGVAAVLQDSGTALQLNITAITVEPGVWVGGIAGVWDPNAGLEWKGAISGNPQTYHDLYPVFFDDSATNFTVNITTNVLPATVSITNSAYNYTWTGAGGISGGATLAKDGAATLLIVNSNNYTGGTFLTNGVLQLGNGGTNGSITGSVMDNGALVFNRADAATLTGVISGTGTVEQRGPGVLTLTGNNTFTGVATVTAGTLAAGSGTALGDTNAMTVVANGATLDVDAQSLGMEPISVQGAGVGGAGAIINSSADNQNALRYVTLNGPTTFGGGFRWDIRDPAPSAASSGVNAYLVGNGYPLTKVGTNIVAFINIGDLGVTDINIKAGTMTISRGTTPGNPANTISVYPGATLQFHRTSEFVNNVINKIVVMTNGTLAVESNGLTNSFSGSLTLNGTNFVNIPTSATGLVLQGPVNGSGSLNANNLGGLLQLTGSCTYSGGTIINGGTFQVDGSVGTGANPLLLTNATLTGSGTISDPVTVPAGSALAPGDSGIGSLTINNSLVLAAGCTNLFELDKDIQTNDNVSVSGSVTYGGNLVLSNLASTVYAPGDSYKLFSAASYSGSFANIVPATPGLGLLWQTNSLTVDGSLKVIVVPTPNPPVALSADSLITNVINVLFNMAVDSGSSQNPANYVLNTTNVVVSATQISATNVQLTLDTALTVSHYTLQVKGVQNLSYVPDTIVTTNVPGRTFGFEAAANILASSGMAFANGNDIHVFGSGADIFNTSDQFEFVYKTFTNDFDLSVCLENLGESDVAAKGGLMAREITDPNGPSDGERMVMVASFPPAPGRAQNLFEWREDTAATAISPAAPRPNSTFPTNWFRLARTGSVISGYCSSNNLDWTFMGAVDSSTNALGAYGSNLRVGLAVTSHNAALLNEGIFSNFGVAKSRVQLSVSQAGGNVVLSWPAPGLGVLLQTTPSLTPPIIWTTVPGTTATNQVQLPLGSGAAFFRLTQ